MAEDRDQYMHGNSFSPCVDRGECDRRVWGKLHPLFRELTAVAMRVVDEEELARDAVQEALLSLWLEADPPPNPRAWLVRAVTFRSLHLARCRSRRRRHEWRARLARPEASDRDDPARCLEEEEGDLILCKGLERLASDHRTILALSLIEELDYRSIARRLGVPVGTVRSRLNRARVAFRDVLTRMLPEESRPRSSCKGCRDPGKED
jgi:RNA polymerase sigma-70 factor (ECF subfamily)